MPRRRKQPNIVSWHHVNNVPGVIGITPEQEEAEMRDTLLSYSLDEIRTDVLILKFVYSYTFEEIARRLRIPSPQSVQYLYDTSLELLKERGYR